MQIGNKFTFQFENFYTRSNNHYHFSAKSVTLAITVLIKFQQNIQQSLKSKPIILEHDWQ